MFELVPSLGEQLGPAAGFSDFGGLTELQDKDCHIGRKPTILKSLFGTWTYHSGKNYHVAPSDRGLMEYVEGTAIGLLMQSNIPGYLEADLVGPNSMQMGTVRLRLEASDKALVQFRPSSLAEWGQEISATRSGGTTATTKACSAKKEDILGSWTYGHGMHLYHIATVGEDLRYAEDDAAGILKVVDSWWQADLADGTGKYLGTVRVKPCAGSTHHSLESQFRTSCKQAWSACVTAVRQRNELPTKKSLLEKPPNCLEQGGLVKQPYVTAAVPSNEPPLSPEQQRLIRLVLGLGQSVFFTGAAGTGKSRCLRELIQRAPESSTFVTGLTGMAATQLPRGTTLHSFAGIGLGKGTKESCLERAQASGKARYNWKEVKLLIVDEISMMSKALFDKLEFVARKMRNCEKPFGGIVLCCCGDFFQLPPVARGAVGDEALFCFESEAWQRCFRNAEGENCFALTQIFRQTDSDLLRLLREVRHNELTDWGVQMLHHLVRPLSCGSIEPTRLVPSNAAADAVNAQCLAALSPEELPEVYEATDNRPRGGQNWTDDSLDALTLLPRCLELKVGAQVMLVRSLSGSLVNGSRGIVEGFLQDGESSGRLPIVRFLSGESIIVERVAESKDLAGGQKFSRFQVPLRLSWAMTIHKSQGMSIDVLEVDLKNVFEAGQAYVALSRARSLNGLRVLSFDARRMWSNTKVVEFYKRRVRDI